MSAYKLVVCPYDEAHKVKESRLQLHIAKCKQNNLDKAKFICPFNATHVLSHQERDYHLLHCPDRAPLDRKMAGASIDKNNPFKGRTAVPSYTASVPIISDEIWDEDVGLPAPGYVPPKEAPPGAIIEPPPMSKPAERRRLYQELHRRNADPVRQQESQSPQAAASIPRQPKQPSEASRLQNLGLGRAKAPVPRIAANIFPSNTAPNSETSSTKSYSSIVNGMANLGLGRGQISNPVSAPTYDDEDEFPALGFGRGVQRIPKNSARAPGRMNRF